MHKNFKEVEKVAKKCKSEQYKITIIIYFVNPVHTMNVYFNNIFSAVFAVYLKF